MTRSDCHPRLALVLLVLLGLMTTACTAPAPAPTPSATAAPAAPAAKQSITLQTLFPDQIDLGQKFNEQPDGRSALAVKVDKATPTSVIVFNGTSLKTEINPDNILTAFVPPELVAKPGTFPVYVTDGGAESNRLSFTIRAP